MPPSQIFHTFPLFHHSVTISVVVFIFIVLDVAAKISPSTALEWEIYPTQIKVGESVAVSYRIPEAGLSLTNMTVTYDGNIVEVFHSKKLPVYGLTMVRVNTSGEHQIDFFVTMWEEISGEQQKAKHNASLWAYHPITDKVAFVTLTPPLSITPPGSVWVKVILKSSGELPTMVSGMITWGNSDPSTAISMENLTLPGARGPLSQVYNHNYSHSGDYAVGVKLRNPVSDVHFVAKVRVLDQLNVLAVEVTSPREVNDEWLSCGVPTVPTVLTTGQITNITALVQSGQPDFFSFIVNGFPYQSQDNFITYTFRMAGEYEVNTTMSGEAGASQPVSTKLLVQSPIEPSLLTIKFSQPIVTPPGEANVTLIVTRSANSTELPTNLTGHVLWDDGQTKNIINLTSQTKPGSKGPVSLVLNHTFEHSGSYHVEFYLCNFISSVILKETVEVQDKLNLGMIVVEYAQPQNMILTPQWNAQVFKTGKTLNISALVEVGVADQFVLVINKQEVAQQDFPTFMHTFDLEGDYEVYIKGYSDTGTSLSESTSVQVRSQLTKLTLVTPVLFFRVMQPVPLTITSSLYLGTCLSLQLGDGNVVGWRKVAGQCEGHKSGKEQWQAKELDSPITFIHMYNTIGIYTITARLFSANDELIDQVNVTVLGELPCDQLSISMDRSATIDSPISTTRADKLWLRSAAEVNCSVPDVNIDIRWRVVRLNDSSEVKLPADVDTTKGTLYLPQHSLHYGLYTAIVIYNISLFNDENQFVWTELSESSVIDVGKSSLVVVLVEGGSPKIRRGTLQTLTLNAGHFSYDPDYPEYSLGSFMWSCLEVGEEIPELDKRTSDPPDSREEYEIGLGRTEGGCWGEGPAWMTNSMQNFSINIDLFRTPNTTYRIDIIVSSRDGRKGSASLEIEVVEGDPPSLISVCAPSWLCKQVEGAQLVNPRKFILQSGCQVEVGEESIGEDGCGEVPLEYTWNVAGVKASHTHSLNITNVTIGVNQQKLALLDSFWLMYASQFQLFDVQVTANRPGELAEGLALQRIKINEPPIGGNCWAKVILEENEEIEVAKREETLPMLAVTALTDLIIIKCSGWQDPENFPIARYSFFATKSDGEKLSLSFSTKSSAKVILPYGQLTLWVGISDQLEAETLYPVARIDPRVPSQSIFDDYKTRNVLANAVNARDQSKVDMLLKAEKSLKGLTPPTEGEYEDKGEEEDEGADQENNKNMLGTLTRFSTTSMEEVIQVNNILGAISNPLPAESQAEAVATLEALAGAADSQAPLGKQKEFATGALSTAANLVQGVNRNVQKQDVTNKIGEVKGHGRIKRETLNVTEDEEVIHDTGWVRPKYQASKEDQDANKKVESLLNVVGGTQTSLLQAAVAGEQLARVDAKEEVNMAVGFINAEKLDGHVETVGGATYVFPSYCDIMGQPRDCLNNKTITIGIQITKWRNQIHGYGGGRDGLNEDSGTVQLSLVDSDRRPLPVYNSSSDFIIHIPRSQESVVVPTVVDAHVSATMPLSIHKVNIPLPHMGVSIMVQPINETSSDDWLLVWSPTELNGTFEFSENIVFFSDMKYHEDTGFYELFLDSEKIGDIPGTYSFGIGRYNTTLSVPEEHPCFEDPPVGTIIYSFAENFTDSYNFSSYVSSCLFFDKEKLSWSNKGCKVVGANLSITTCACNHLTSFGSGFFVAPNAIDFNYVFANAGFTDNLTIYITLIISLALYLVGLIYARIKDRQDVMKVGVVPLADNDSNDHYLYFIIVHTGHIPNSGTKSKVQFLLTGDWEETDVRTLNDGNHPLPLLQRGATDHFVMATQRPLGPLHYLRIWHDNGGGGRTSSWFLGYIVVRDVQTGEQFQFICNQWLAVEECDGKIDRLIAVAGEKQLREASHLFTHSVDKSLGEDHLWFSIFFRSPRSRFTRVQRLSSCMALLYLSMLVNAMFYQQIPDDSSGSGALRLGPLSISPQALGIGFISNLIVFPPSFTIVFFFRKARPRKPKVSRLRVALMKQKEGLESESSKSTISWLPCGLSASSNTSPSTLMSVSTKEENPNNKEPIKAGQRNKFSLPWWCVYVAWTLCVICIFLAVFFLWAYGIQFGNKKTTKWLTALLSSIFSSVLFTQPIKIYLTSLLLAWVLKRPLEEFEDYDDDEEQFFPASDEEHVYGPPTAGSGMNQHSSFQIGTALSEEEIATAKSKRLSEVAMQDLLVEVLVYLIFLTIILSVSHGTKDPNIFHMRENIKNTFVINAHSESNCPSFTEVQNTSEMWCWMRETLAGNLLDTRLYNGDPRPHNMCGTLIDRVNFMLGHSVLRQIRHKPGDPNKHPVTRGNKEDNRDFGLSWNVSLPIHSHYTYSSALKLHSFPYDGNLDTYGGGGYVVELRGIKRKVVQTLKSLEMEKWLDENTQALFIEFAVYNPQVNLFAVTMLIFEFFPGGGLLTKFEFQALKLLRYHTPGGGYVLASEILYILFTLFYTRREFMAMKKLKSLYLKSVWNVLELWIIALSYTAIVFYLLKTSLTYYLIDDFIETKGKKYIRIQPLAFLDSVLGFVIAFQVFIGTLKVLKLLKFNKRIGMLSATLKYASADIIGFGLIFLVTLISFVSFFYLNTFTYVEEFSSFIKACESSFFLITKKFKEIANGSPILGPLFYFIFAFILNWIVFQLLIAIICHAFEKVNRDISKQPNDYEVVEYMANKFSSYLSGLRPNAVQKVSIQPPKQLDIDTQIRNLDISLTQIMKAIDK